MSSKRGGARGSAAASSPSFRGKSSAPQKGHYSYEGSNDSDLSTDPAQGGEWEVVGKKSRNRGGSVAAKPKAASSAKNWSNEDMSQSQGGNGNSGTGNTNSCSWAQACDLKRHTSKGSTVPHIPNKGWAAAYMAPPPEIPAPLPQGWQWAARSGSSQSNAFEDNVSRGKPSNEAAPLGEDYGSDIDEHHSKNNSDYDDLLEESDQDLLSDDYDSDVSQKSHETRKKNKWFNTFFEALDKLTNDQISEPSRQWHCPACQGGPGAIDWYRGLQPLMTHAKTKGSIRAMLHRDFAELLEEELLRRGTSVVPMGEAFGKWKGLRETATDHDIVWPPMVVVMNTLLDRDENEKWIGMGNQELLDYFESYDAIKARHSYGPMGHRGMSMLIFEGSAIGYLEAERLHKHFADEGTDREAWQRRKVLFSPGGQRQLYGYLACKEDLDFFNQHSQGKSRLKYEIRSYQEMVVGPMKQMSEDNQLLLWYKNKVEKQQRHKKTLEQTVGMISNQLRITSKDNIIVRERTKQQHKENMEQMDYMENYCKDQIASIRETLEARERAFEKSFQEERDDKEKLSNSDYGTKEERKLRSKEIARFIESQTKEIKDFEAERERLVRAHEDKKAELRKEYLAADVELEKQFVAELTHLMEKYKPNPSEASTSSIQ